MTLAQVLSVLSGLMLVSAVAYVVGYRKGCYRGANIGRKYTGLYDAHAATVGIKRKLFETDAELKARVLSAMKLPVNGSVEAALTALDHVRPVFITREDLVLELFRHAWGERMPEAMRRLGSQ